MGGAVTTTRLLDHPVVIDLLRRLYTASGAAVLLCFGLVHLLVWPGAPTGTPGERYRWNGDTHLLDWLPASAVWWVAGILLGVTVLGHAAGAAGLVGIPGLRRHHLATTGTGCAASLGLYAITWPGLEPTPTDFSAGPVISGLLLACVLATAWARYYPPEPGGPPHRPGRRPVARTARSARSAHPASTSVPAPRSVSKPQRAADAHTASEPWMVREPRRTSEPLMMSERGAPGARVVRASSSRPRLSRADGSHRRRAHPVE
ncbi:membrane hypothetical protein [Frankia sp. AiPs1]